MSYATYYARRFLGDARYEELKANVLGAGVAQVVQTLPKGEGGSPPRAIIDTRVSLANWQPIAVGAAILLFAYYLFTQR